MLPTLLQLLMPHCAGASGARRCLMAGIVKVNGETVTDENTLIHAHDDVTLGKHRTIQ